ncbi:hypothetical protein F5Y14DRAFT_3559 [Nemania sp. NC0429]|nr:hypothetical protein F5Y14DRAFT_3559 [Nemania sp. NC0429]
MSGHLKPGYLEFRPPMSQRRPVLQPPFASMLFASPLKLFVFPFAFLAALPLALCAGVTTILAFLVLFLRLFLVYFDVGLETLRHVLVGPATQGRYITVRGATPRFPPSSLGTTLTLTFVRQCQSRRPSTSSPPPPSPVASTSRHRRRAKRQGSSGSITPISGFDGLSSVTPSIGLERDFEGVGGWRLESVDEQQWYNLNSRLENPYRRHHFRSQSGSAAVPGIIVAKPGSHSPERSRSIGKAKGLARADQDGYFNSPFTRGGVRGSWTPSSGCPA